jgi:putative salt-induced outer membrane protein YdiY
MTMPRPRAALPGACAWLAVALCAWSTAALADKTDVITLRNGDRITGEIKNVQRGRLQLSTDSMGTVYIEWKDITRVTSPEIYVIELQDGTRLDGSFEATDKDNRLLLAYRGEERYVDMQSVVFVDPLKLDASRLKRWDGSVSAGFDATKANNDTSLSATFTARRRAEDFLLNVSGSVFSRSQDGVDDSLRANFGAVYRGLLERRWFWAGVGFVERNDELGIDLRSLAGAGYGRYLVQTGRALWSATAGLALVNEQRAGDEDAETNLEGFLNTEFEYFTYDSPKTSLTTSLTLFPSVTDSGRIRGNFELGLRRELVTDLFVEISFYNSYDSRPPEEGETNDYGIVTSLGYTF